MKELLKWWMARLARSSTLGQSMVTCRDGMVRALEVIRYVPEAWYNLISVEVLDEKECRIQVQQDVIMVSQGNKVILKGEKY